ncbi:non-ribosomal peptide synthetase [Saccharothrix variisporea]|uniref:Amino acid adenylation domain-containing protein n=1 Tax=Saccharothrix variisporea TaxID=543527 RepID=A0A495X0T2_9PSEU|nr:non-ribosomal peptide synthetase [Saccharothrix variisporea]RKT67520.1 amino acid adenylation domain-containing protein [Saccharothrix variisporea]
MTVHTLVAAAATAHPSRIAVVSSERSLTYGELDARANGLAARLVASGVRPGDPVGVFLHRSAEFVLAALAVLKAGGHYVPLDPEYPAARLEYMLGAVSSPVVVTVGSLAGRVPGPVVLLDELPEPADPVDVAVHPDDLAYVMFTSGSTGKPKGVAVTHRGIVRLVREPGCVSLDGETMLHLSSPSFDAATFDIWGALANGGRLVVAPAGKASVAEIGEWVRSHGVTTAFFPTGLFHLVVDEGVAALEGLRQVVVGGDVLSAAHARRFLAAMPGCRLVNGYGPTEVTTFTTFHDVRPVDGPVPIGTPLNRTYVRVLDDDLQPAVEGQLFAGGDGVARGYVGDPALTAQRFVPDPWVPGGRLYATGDLVRETPDGLEFLGRIDGQVKKRGYRVEPGEVEAALRDDPAVRDAVVVATGDRADTRRLEAFLVLSGPLAEVRERMAEVLPEYLVPDVWVELPVLPLTPNGKVDRAALVSQPRGSSSVEPPSTEEPPLTETETVIAEIWREVLDVESVGRHDDFFALGGHSLIANRIVSRMRRTLGVDVRLVAVFDHPTVAGLAEHVSR